MKYGIKLSPYLTVAWQPLQTLIPLSDSVKQNGHLIISFLLSVMLTPFYLTKLELYINVGFSIKLQAQP